MFTISLASLVAIAFAEAGAGRVAARLGGFDRLFSSNLLEAELRSALAREGVTSSAADLLAGIAWIYPDRRLTPEFDRIVTQGHVKGADLWHLACALFLAESVGELAFVTLDARQGDVAARLGLRSRI